MDGHTHPVFGVTSFLGADLSRCRDLDDLRAALRAAGAGTAEAAGGGWVVGFGLDHNGFAGQPPTHAVLDEVLPGRPALVRLYDGHSALASSEALRRSSSNFRRPPRSPNSRLARAM